MRLDHITAAVDAQLIREGQPSTLHEPVPPQRGPALGAARQVPGNAGAHERFSIDCPPRFQSRTCDPADPLFIGKSLPSRAPNEATSKALSEATAGLGQYRPVGMLKRAGQ